MNYKTIIRSTLAAILLFSTVISLAQHHEVPPEKKEQIDKMKIGFITARLDLTTEEAQNFWPVYNAFQKEREALQKERKQHRMNLGNVEEISNSEAEALIEQEVGFKEKELAIERKYAEEFKKVLPAKKIVQLLKAEHDFKRILLKRLQERKKPPMPPRK